MAIQLVLLALAFCGHLVMWIGVFNRVHAMRLPGWVIRTSELVLVLSAACSPVWLMWKWSAQPHDLDYARRSLADHSWLATYLGVCWIVAVIAIGVWTRRLVFGCDIPQLVSNHTDKYDVAAKLGFRPMRGWSTRVFAFLPGNQMFKLHVHEKVVELDRLPADLDGLSIAHLSDLHFCGKITRPYFDFVVERAMELEADLIAITGDILEAEECYAWLPETLGRLKAPFGCYFILGNHERRLRDAEQLRRELTALGMVDAGRTAELRSIRGQSVLFAGNELPWYGPPPEWPAGSDDAFRVLLSHSPDQIVWAKEQNVDLMLAGHTHGGHIRLPVVGPLVCPSKFGVKYASGVFYEEPTLMQVSRGISGLDPLRINCPPELTKLVLRSKNHSSQTPC